MGERPLQRRHVGLPLAPDLGDQAVRAAETASSAPASTAIACRDSDGSGRSAAASVSAAITGKRSSIHTVPAKRSGEAKSKATKPAAATSRPAWTRNRPAAKAQSAGAATRATRARSRPRR